MRSLVIVLSLAFTATPGLAQARTGAFRAEAQGWSVTLPAGWKFVEKDGAVVAGHDNEAGLLAVYFEAGATLASLQKGVADGFAWEGLYFRARGPGTMGHIGKNATLFADFEASAADGTVVVASALGVVGATGAVTVLGVTDTAHSSALKRRVNEAATSVRFMATKAPAAARGVGELGALRGALCAYAGGSVSSRTSRATFDGAGHFSWGTETAMGGSLNNQYGDETGRFTGSSGNQYAPTNGGTYAVTGNTVTIQWAGGEATRCTVNFRQNNGAITELMCDGTLYGAGLCE